MNIKKIRKKLLFFLIIMMFLLGACGKNEDKEDKENILKSENGQQKETKEKSLPVPENIKLSEEELLMKINETKNLKAVLTPENADSSTVHWKSNNIEIASVDNQGTITAKSAGETMITAFAGKIQSSCKVTVQINMEQLSWVVTPQYDYQNVIAVADMFPQDMADSAKERVGNYCGRVFYYINEQAGMTDYNGNILIDNSKALFTDKFYGIVSKAWKSYDTNGKENHLNGGGGGYSFYWNELTQKIIYSEMEFEEKKEWSHEYMVSMKSVNLDSKFLDSMNTGGNALQENGTYRLVGKNGLLVSQEQFEDIKTDKKNFYENVIGDYAVVKKNGLWGYIREDGTWLSECVYEDAYPFHDGIAAVKKNGKAGFIREDGTEAFDFLFEETRSVYLGKAWVKVDGKWGILDIAELAKLTVPDYNTPEQMQAAAVDILRQKKAAFSNNTFFDYDMDGKLEFYYGWSVGGGGNVGGDIYGYEDGKYYLIDSFNFDKAYNEYYTVYKNSAGEYLFMEHTIGNTFSEEYCYISIYNLQTKQREQIGHSVENADKQTKVYYHKDSEISEEEYNQLLEAVVQGYEQIEVTYNVVYMGEDNNLEEKVKEAWNGYSIKQ